MICQDCAKKEATKVRYDQNKGVWFFVCEDCIKEEDLVCDYSIKKTHDLYEE